MRSIDDRFIKDLHDKDGKLSFFLKQVIERRKELSLEIRNGYVNIYYRGGNLLRIRQRAKGYKFEFNANYCLNKGDGSKYGQISRLDPVSADDYEKAFDLLVSEIQGWLLAHPKPEREYQHNLLLHNPSIIDVEYQIKRGMRLDMLMVKDRSLIVVENKYGTGAVSGSAGLAKHYADIYNVLNTPDLREELYDSVESIIDCKEKLQLLRTPIAPPDREKYEILFILANYNQRSRTFLNELKDIEPSIPARVLFTESDEYEINLDMANDMFAI